VLTGIVAGAMLGAGPGALAGAGLAGTAPAGGSARAWTDQAHDTPLELLAGRIASHIAGRSVSVDCETSAAWFALAKGLGIDPAAESGYVATSWNGDDGQLIGSSSTAVLAPGICGPLARFALASSTECPAGARTTLGLAPSSPPARCSGSVLKGAGSSARHAASSIAILTLAHESVHLGGIVGGTLSNGVAVGDPQAEAKADCYGMQWMPYVAEQLGDSPADAQAIATYFWKTIYPLGRTANPAYWTRACRPGGALDLRLHAGKSWP